MVPIPQGNADSGKHHVARRIPILVIALAVAAGCADSSPASSESQRRIGEARLQDDLFVSLTYGAVRGFNETELVVRSASPLVSLDVEMGPEVQGPVDVELRNVHREAELRVTTAAILDATDIDGCPVVAGAEFDCVAANEAIGEGCETSGQCPAGLRCATGTCTATNLFDVCTPPESRRLIGQETSLSFELPAEPCRRQQLETVLPEGQDEDLRFAVIGPSRDVQLISDLADEFRDEELDFVVLLGDNIDTANVDGLAELERVLILLGTPVVVVAGPRELSADNGQEFLRRFGPHDHVWSLKGNRFFAFYSAPATLGPRGLSRLETFLGQLSDEEGDSPLIGVTHVPPFDPEEQRDSGFRNELEAAQLVSTFESRGVDQLFAGSLGTGFERFHDLEVITTTARGTFVQRRSEWVLVESRVGEHPEDGRVVGNRTLSFERVQIVK